MKRTLRLKAIREIIKANKVASQEELIEELSRRGFEVTQSTISRDIKFLNLVKARNYMQEEYYTLNSKYVSDPASNIQKVKSRFRANVISIERAKSIIVIKTNPGEAQGVAATIDGMNFEEILGTVGGDDTIICIASSEDNAEKIVKIFKEF